ncbi:unnamed protein product [Dibothriocephalus latus]|uniref:Uncharacterized protein n=1 Tax=Dibothriocephalus latus TaxID=60516 RepID=A0A3P7NAH2_DIBLA|nr:unnamed protein product [Dibothriocephalus latus]
MSLAVFSLLSFFCLIIIRLEDLYRIETFNHPLPTTAPTELFGIITAQETWVTILISGITLSVDTLAGVSFLVGSLAFCLISERASNAKHLQFVSGARLGACTSLS